MHQYGHLPEIVRNQSLVDFRTHASRSTFLHKPKRRTKQNTLRARNCHAGALLAREQPHEGDAPEITPTVCCTWRTNKGAGGVQTGARLIALLFDTSTPLLSRLYHGLHTRSASLDAATESLALLRPKAPSSGQVLGTVMLSLATDHCPFGPAVSAGPPRAGRPPYTVWRLRSTWPAASSGPACAPLLHARPLLHAQ